MSLGERLFKPLLSLSENKKVCVAGCPHPATNNCNFATLPQGEDTLRQEFHILGQALWSGWKPDLREPERTESPPSRRSK